MTYHTHISNLTLVSIPCSVIAHIVTTDELNGKVFFSMRFLNIIMVLFLFFVLLVFIFDYFSTSRSLYYSQQPGLETKNKFQTYIPYAIKSLI